MKNVLLITVILSILTIAPQALAKQHRWKSLSSEAELSDYLWAEFDRKYYPTKVKCRSRNNGFEVKFTTANVGPDKPFHKWNATFLRDAESMEQAAARLPVKGHPDLQYKIHLSCSAGGKTIVVAFRGTRKMD